MSENGVHLGKLVCEGPEGKQSTGNGLVVTIGHEARERHQENGGSVELLAPETVVRCHLGDLDVKLSSRDSKEKEKFADERVKEKLSLFFLRWLGLQERYAGKEHS
jgi:hypothetical protein